MKITLTKMDDKGFTFLCTELSTVELHHGLWTDSDVTIHFFEGIQGRWDADDANPRRRDSNTLTLTAVRKLPFVREAIKAAQARHAELHMAYQDDHSLFEAQREIYKYHCERLLADLRKAIEADPTDEGGTVQVAAWRYGDLESPKMLDNPFAYISRIRKD